MRCAPIIDAELAFRVPRSLEAVIRLLIATRQQARPINPRSKLWGNLQTSRRRGLASRHSRDFGRPLFGRIVREQPLELGHALLDRGMQEAGEIPPAAIPNSLDRLPIGQGGTYTEPIALFEVPPIPLTEEMSG